ncbi:MAG: ATP-binding protein [Bacteroidales bacterium]|nr:ATP-binding protein [Candidatus Cryptobacteroides choladohippi]
MKRLEGQQQNDFEQIIDDRYHRKLLILSSQLAVADWYGVFSNEMLAEACLDRIAHKSLRFELKGDSMRKKYRYLCESNSGGRVSPESVADYPPEYLG